MEADCRDEEREHSREREELPRKKHLSEEGGLTLGEDPGREDPL